MADRVSVQINEMLQSSSPMSADVCIFRVPNFLREVNKKAYEPKLLAIGPYQDHGKDHFKAMEAHKIQYLQLLLQERREDDVSKYVMKMKDLEENARKRYAEPVSLNSDDFVKMMLLDGCFIVQLFRQSLKLQPTYPNDLVFKVPSLFKPLHMDLLLVENQLPFFVIWELYKMVESCNQVLFQATVFNFFSAVFPYELRIEDWKPIKQINHLLDFVHHCSHHDPRISYINTNTRNRWNSIGCATKLEEAGMKFKMDKGNSLFDITFESGTMKIPLLQVGDYTESLLRNLVAFKQLQPGKNLHHVTDFIVFMDDLIDSAQDVEILRRHGIVKNLLGDNEKVATMFNRLGDNVIFSSKNFYYSQVSKETEDYCKRCQRWQKYIAYLKRNYFNSPWAPLVSVVVAFTILVLTFLQTIYTILSYY